ELSPNVADRLFRQNGNTFEPALEMGKTDFVFQIPGTMAMHYRRSPDYVGHQVSVQDVKIENLSAQKVIPGDPNFSLIFDASFDIVDKSVVTDLVALLHENFYVTFAPMQPGLFDEADSWKNVDLLCRLCDAPNPEWDVENSTPKLAYCDKCVRKKEDHEKVIRIRDTAKAEAVADDMSGDGDEEGKGADPLLAGADINRRAAQRQRSGRRAH
ncbi:MAG TPA: hypothetical protein VFL19_04885, partial [Nitrospira sp.]|nr:hypothetical protein [Nitrospira sp.]